MKYSISNIAWTQDDDEKMYQFLVKTGFHGLEIAPTRIFPNDPYSDLEAAKRFANDLLEKFNLEVCSLQSIWYGRSEKMFVSKQERDILFDYTKKAIDFAQAVGAKNLVFGSPKSRVTENDNDYEIAVSFFKKLAQYAYERNTILSIEPNPEIYGTNFITKTNDAFKLVKDVSTQGFKVNIDFGTIIQNNEDITPIIDNLSLVNHIHISEPYLELIEKRDLHKRFASQLKDKKYDNFVSIEMKNLGDLDKVMQTMHYIKKVFGDN